MRCAAILLVLVTAACSAPKPQTQPMRCLFVQPPTSIFIPCGWKQLEA